VDKFKKNQESHWYNRLKARVPHEEQDDGGAATPRPQLGWSRGRGGDKPLTAWRVRESGGPRLLSMEALNLTAWVFAEDDDMALDDRLWERQRWQLQDLQPRTPGPGEPGGGPAQRKAAAEGGEGGGLRAYEPTRRERGRRVRGRRKGRGKSGKRGTGRRHR